jgi:hypothetical protein
VMPNTFGFLFRAAESQLTRRQDLHGSAVRAAQPFLRKTGPNPAQGFICPRNGTDRASHGLVAAHEALFLDPPRLGTA